MLKTGDGKNVNIISNSGNGVGNQIVIEGDGSGSTTIINGYPNGVGNKIIINGQNILNQPGLMDNRWIPNHVKQFMPPGFGNPLLAGQTNVVYPGKENPFYEFAVFSPEMNGMLYWDTQTQTFFRYSALADCYLPINWLTAPPQPMPEVKD